MKYYAIFEKTDGYYSLCYDLPVLSYGETLEKALETTREGIVNYITDCRQRGAEVPVPTPYETVVAESKQNKDLSPGWFVEAIEI